MNELIMALLIGALAIVQILGGAVIGLLHRIIAAIPAYGRALAIGTIAIVGSVLVTIPALIILKIFTGWSWAVYTAALLAVVFTLLLTTLWAPAAIAVGTVFGIDRLGVRRYFRMAGTIFFAELMASLAVLWVPFHQNLGMLPVFLLVGAAVLVAGMVWGGWLSAGFYRGVAGLAFLVILLSFFLPRTFEVAREKAGRIDEGLATALTVQPAAQAQLAAGKPLCANQKTFRPNFEIVPEMEIKISPDCWSGWVTIPNQAKFRISSPDNLEILTWQGDWLFIEPDSAEWLGEVRFSNFRLSGGGSAVVFVERR